MPQQNDESQIVIALQAMQNNPKLSARAAAKIYPTNHQKISRRKRGIPSRCDIPANSRKLTDLEEQVLIQYILDLAAKGFPLWMSIVEDIVNRLLAIRDTLYIGSH